MTPIQQQRLIGAGLLVLMVTVLAYVVLSKVGQHQTEQSLELPEPIEFSSVIEPIDEDGVEKVKENSEAMVDADLQQSTSPQVSVVAANDSKSTETDAESAETTNSLSTETKAKPAETSETETPAQPVDRPVAQAETTAPEAHASNTENPTVVSEPNAGTATSGDKWVIQLGSFSVQNNAQSLKAEAEKLGYKPYIENSQTDKGVIYRVRLPAVASRAQADDIAAKINVQLGTKAQVSKQ
ncbi:MAG: SPOR domain-containing protein [Methylophaga sp.]